MTHKKKRNGDTRSRETDGNDCAMGVVKTLVTGGAESSHLLELYYWSREPGIIELIRAYLEMPEHAQRALSDYLRNSRPQSMKTEIDMSGRLVLSQAGAGSRARPDRQRQTSKA